MHSSVQSSNAPPPSRRSDAPLTAERAMMDQIRSKLERAQRRLARNAPSSSSSSYIPSSEYNSAMHKAPVKSVLMEDMPATASRHYAPPSTTRQPPSTRHHGMPPPPSTARYGMPPSSRRPPSSKYDASSRQHSSRYAQQQYKSRSKYSQGDADPLNGGPPPMSTPYLVYSSSRPPMTGSQHSKSKGPPTEHKREEKHRHRAPSSSYFNTSMNGPPSAMRSGIARPPTSRVRFEGHEEERRESIKKMELDNEERKHRKEREARHLRHREREMKNVNARAKGKGPASPIAATRGRRSGSVENPPKSAIKLSAYEDIAQAIPTSPVGRPRRSSINNPPPKSDIKISAFEDMVPRRRSSGAQNNPPKPAEPEKSEEPEKPEENVADTPENDDTREQKVIKLKVAGVEAEAVVDQTPVDNQETVEAAPEVVESPPPSVVPESEEPSRSEEEDAGDTSAYDTDDSYEFDSDSEYLSSSGYSMFEAHVLEVDVEMDVYSDDSDEDSPPEDTNGGNQEPEADKGDEDVPTPPATELSTVREEDEDEQAPVSRLSAKDLAFYALGRTNISSISDAGSPVSSINGKQSPKHAPPPMSYTPASSAFPRSRALGRPPVPATTGRALAGTRSSRILPPSSTTSIASYVRRSRARAPMDLKNQLPPSIGVLSGLSSGSSAFVMDPKYFYEVTWKSGEFAFSVQRVYTDENEFEFDDRTQEPQLFLRMLLNTERSTCRSFDNVRVGDVLIRVGDAYVSDLGLEGSGTVLTKFFAKMMAQTPIKLTFQRMAPSDWEGGVEL
ncbi:hypothetical protein V7S43_002389 [Phytophthora oleae]|uniref:PDZ domain-containing protein n=1 Tax=Phytophthora oleae TaxID=2107226 RepID=A0ABD3G3P3_9STRA